MFRDACQFDGDCGSCLEAGGPVVCHCLGITEDEIVTSLITLELRSIRELRRHTGAGSGCNCCHRKLQTYIDTYSSSSLEICSAR